eukprot:1643439-Alexandrium_andersonii.AAC.1
MPSGEPSGPAHEALEIMPYNQSPPGSPTMSYSYRAWDLPIVYGAPRVACSDPFIGYGAWEGPGRGPNR